MGTRPNPVPGAGRGLCLQRGHRKPRESVDWLEGGPSGLKRPASAPRGGSGRGAGEDERAESGNRGRRCGRSDCWRCECVCVFAGGAVEVSVGRGERGDLRRLRLAAPGGAACGTPTPRVRRGSAGKPASAAWLRAEGAGAKGALGEGAHRRFRVGSAEGSGQA